MKKSNRGMALIAVLAVFSLISLLAVYFLFSARMNSIKLASVIAEDKARLLAKSGLEIAIAELKYGIGGARDNYCDTKTEDWYFKAGAGVNPDNVSSVSGNDSFTSMDGIKRNIPLGGGKYGFIAIKVLDSASQINLNDSNPNLQSILANLPGLNGTLAGNIINYRNSLSSNMFTYEEELLSVPGITRNIYDAVKDYVTIYSWEDTKATTSYNTSSFSTVFSTRSPVNVNTAPRDVIYAVLAPVIPADAANVANAVSAHTSTTPFYSWADFNSFIDTLSLSAAVKNIIKNNANPNRIKPAGGYTTEFSFQAGGYYEVEVIGEVKGMNGRVIARKKVSAFIKTYKIARHTTKFDFRDEDTNNDGDNSDTQYGEGNFDTNFENSALRVDNTNYIRVTWLDSCPVDEGDEAWPSYSGIDPNEISPFPYRTIPNSVKLGFWDNFDEDAGTNQSRAWWGNEFNHAMEISDVGSHYNYIYSGSDFSDVSNAGLYDGINPTAGRLHTYDDVLSGARGFHLDDIDREIWAFGSGSPLKNITINDFSKFYLGGVGVNLGNNPSSSSLQRAYRFWVSDDGFYIRAKNYDGPRASIGTQSNFPTYQPISIPPGRGYADIGDIEMFDGTMQFYLYPIGNVYGSDGHALKSMDGTHYIVKGSGFYARVNPRQGDYSGFRYQRDKIYKAAAYNHRIRFYVHNNNFSYTHPGTFNADGKSGKIWFYSNANQTAWDDVRIIDNDGRFAKHFVIDEEVNLGAFHMNAVIPSGAHVYFMGTNSGGRIRSGISSVDISLAGEENHFSQLTSPYYANIDISNLGPGVSAIEGPSNSGETLFSYSVRMSLNINSGSPAVPVVEDVTLTYLPDTKIIYCYEK